MPLASDSSVAVPVPDFSSRRAILSIPLCGRSIVESSQHRPASGEIYREERVVVIRQDDPCSDIVIWDTVKERQQFVCERTTSVVINQNVSVLVARRRNHVVLSALGVVWRLVEREAVATAFRQYLLPFSRR